MVDSCAAVGLQDYRMLGADDLNTQRPLILDAILLLDPVCYIAQNKLISRQVDFVC